MKPFPIIVGHWYKLRGAYDAYPLKLVRFNEHGYHLEPVFFHQHPAGGAFGLPRAGEEFRRTFAPVRHAPVLIDHRTGKTAYNGNPSPRTTKEGN